jgi:translation initiation factor IF-1
VLFGETVTVYCDNRTEHTNTLPNNIQESSLYLTANTLRLRYKAQPVMLFGETVAVYCENRMEHTTTLCDSMLRSVVCTVTAGL